ncbi:hypothetical protein [Rhizobium croatiense]|nr:hypothetical protein [Rhizobium croatiense]
MSVVIATIGAAVLMKTPGNQPVRKALPWERSVMENPCDMARSDPG